jgi:hypothetical protein
MNTLKSSERSQTTLLSVFLLVWALGFGTFLFDREDASVASLYELPVQEEGVV